MILAVRVAEDPLCVGRAIFAQTSPVVQVFGCRHDDAIHALRRPASEKRQGTKSREVGTGGAAGAMEI
jgi:hypothetical protein